MEQTVKRSRNPTTSPDKSSDKPTDKLVKLDVCKKCNKTVSEDCTVLSVTGALNGSTEPVLTLKNLSWLCYLQPQKIFCFFAAVVCLYFLML